MTHAMTTASALKTIRVVAESRDDQASAVDALDDGGHVERENADPREDEEQMPVSAIISTIPCFACHCSSGSCFSTSSGMTASTHK